VQFEIASRREPDVGRLAGSRPLSLSANFGISFLRRRCCRVTGFSTRPAGASCIEIDHRSGVVMDKPMKGFLKFFMVFFGGSVLGNPE
jgi:hypothetical protein